MMEGRAGGGEGRKRGGRKKYTSDKQRIKAQGACVRICLCVCLRACVFVLEASMELCQESMKIYLCEFQ